MFIHIQSHKKWSGNNLLTAIDNHICPACIQCCLHSYGKKKKKDLILDRKPTLKFQCLSYNLLKICQQTSSTEGAGGDPFTGCNEDVFLPWTTMNRADLSGLSKQQVSLCKAKLASGTRTKISVNTTPVLLYTDRFTKATITSNNITYTAVYTFTLLTKPECYSIYFDISDRFPVRFDKFFFPVELLNRFTEVNSIRK